jgi:phenylpropionate dioxygenase-like ring-hydroxylating dioxygenase large terminal subunit
MPHARQSPRLTAPYRRSRAFWRSGLRQRNRTEAATRDLRRVPIHPDHWYPLAWSREVKAGQTHGVQFAGDPIVLVRTATGRFSRWRIAALIGRCRSARAWWMASQIRCCYHGWTYDCSGRCIDVPYLGKERLPNGVRAYPCEERAGLIFVFPGNPALAGQQPLPEFASVADKHYKTRRFGREVKCHYSFMPKLMDMNHRFLHRRQMGMMRARR